MKPGSRFYSRIILPSLIAVLLFLVAIYLIVIPDYRENLMDKKRETIRELTNTAWSVMHKLELMSAEGFDRERAQAEAALIIGDMRYGPDMKDYFWITDTTPRMIMHPYRPSMVGMDLSDYRDSRGKNFFVDIVDIVRDNGDGYVDYKWQWKDDSLTVVSKLSYVKAFEPWGWIVGTGIYIDDVNREISALTRKVALISALITLLISAIIAYLTQKNYATEKERQKASNALHDSMQRYKKLVEASTDGIVMVLDDKIVYCNPFLLNLLEFPANDADASEYETSETLMQVARLPGSMGDKYAETNDDPGLSERKVKTLNGNIVDVVVNEAAFELGGRHGRIYTVKDVSQHRDIERELDLSIEKLKLIADIMQLGVFRCTLERRSRFVEVNRAALTLFGIAQESNIKSLPVQDLFDRADEKKRVIKAITGGAFVKNRLLRIRRPDGTAIPVLVTLFPVSNAAGNPVYCDGIITDAGSYLNRATFTPGSAGLFPGHLAYPGVMMLPVRECLVPVPGCDMDTKLSLAARLMDTADSGIILVTGTGSEAVGVLCPGDIGRRLLTSGLDGDAPVSRVMSAPVIYINEDAMIMEALTRMSKNRISHLIIKKESDKRYYSVSLSHLLSRLQHSPEIFIDRLKKAGGTAELEMSLHELPSLIGVLTASGTGMAFTGGFISTVSDIVTGKLLEEAVQALGSPPAPFAFLALGSEGRREQTLATDQDNAIIYELVEGADSEKCRHYFLMLGARVCHKLDSLGFPLCKGGVMAMNDAWCMEMDAWKKTVSSWINKPDPGQVLQTSIFFDFRPVYGESRLADELQAHIFNQVGGKDIFFYNLAKSIVNLKLPAFQFENKKEGIEYDLKLPFLAVTSIARLWSLKYNIRERNTSGRLLLLEAEGAISEELREHLQQAFGYLVSKRLKNQLDQMQLGVEVNNSIALSGLSEFDKMVLKRIEATISDHRNRLSMEYKIL